MTTASGAVASLLVLVTILVTLTKLSRNNINKRAPSLGLPILEESAQRNREGEAVLSTSCPGRKPRKEPEQESPYGHTQLFTSIF